MTVVLLRYRLQQHPRIFGGLGLNVDTPLGVISNKDQTHTGRCLRCNRYDVFLSGLGRAVEPALQHSMIRLWTNSMRTNLKEPLGSGNQQVIITDGNHEEVSGEIVVSSCGAINSAALLLHSANDNRRTLYGTRGLSVIGGTRKTLATRNLLDSKWPAKKPQSRHCTRAVPS